MSQPSASDAEAALIALYVLAEQTLLAGIAVILNRPATTYTAQLAAVGQIRQLANQVIAQLGEHTPPLVQAVIADAVDKGVKQAMPETAEAAAAHTVITARDLDGSVVTSTGPAPRRPRPETPADAFDFSMSHGDRAAQAILHDLTSELDDVRYRITRLPDDVYKIIGPQGAIRQVAGQEQTAITAQAQAYKEFIRQGVTGFTDKGGREWSMSAYTEMAVRTATTRSRNAAGIAVIQATGNNLVAIHDDGHSCPRCFPWQDVVCCIVADGVHPTMAEAIAAGVGHPNCRHVWTVVIVGVTPELKPKEWTQTHQDAYNATQRQRAYELNIRKAKKQLEYSRDADTTLEAKQDIAANQARIRKLLADKDLKLKRQSRREQPDLSLSR